MKAARATYEWTGNLAFLESVEVELPYDDPTLYVGDDEEWVLFEVEVNQPNGMVDEEPRNNKANSRFHRVPTWSYPDLDDNRLIVWTKTNQVAWETSVELLDAAGNVVWERGYPTANTTFKDTLSLNQGCYRFTINDVGDDGQSFWANSDGSGYTRLKKVAGGNFINFEPDFGRYISQAFFFQTNLVAVEEELPVSPASMVVFPNPSDGVFQVSSVGFKLDRRSTGSASMPWAGSSKRASGAFNPDFCKPWIYLRCPLERMPLSVSMRGQKLSVDSKT